MAREEDFWNNLDAAFEPSEVLTGKRGDELYCNREHSPENEMKQIFRKSIQRARPTIAFFSGHRGSGKSSLLWRLLEHCASDYFIVYYDVEYNLEKDKANQIDLLYLLGAAIFQVAVQESFSPDAKNLQALHDSIYTLTDTIKDKPKDESFDVVELAKGLLVFGAGMVGSKVGEKIAEALLKPFKITSGVSEEIAKKREIEPQVQNIVNNVNFIIADVQQKTGKPILVIVDGLDKIQRIELAELIFIESGALRGPRCSLVYTVPMSIQTMPKFNQVMEECKSYILPNVKTYHESEPNPPYENGYVTLREVVQKRLKPLQLTADDVFETGVLDILIQKSGGVMRWFILLVQDALEAAERMELDKVSRYAAQEAIDSRVASMTAQLTTKDRAELALVRKDKSLSGELVGYELLHALFILAYRNGKTWYDAHPLLWDYI